MLTGELADELESWCEAELGRGAWRRRRRRMPRPGRASSAPAAGCAIACRPLMAASTTALDVRALALIRETLARHSGLADFAFAMQGLGSGTISLFGTEAQKQSYLPAVAKGEKIAAFALTEPASGSDVAAMETTAEEAGGGYRRQRRQDLHLQRRHRRFLRPVRPHRRGAGREGHFGLHRRCRHRRASTTASASR